ncbi:MAG: glycoside hydrolase family 2 protein [Rhodopirellula sp. JB044]|uniref:glycoside hydrolase family 2 protein n=1 Tax=Rhodopirellula sp. JB044 TaxID=3342844 RepID=UPI00370CD9F7
MKRLVRVRVRCVLFSCVVSLFLQSGLSAGGLPEGYPASQRRKVVLTPHWKFHRGDPDASFYGSDVDDSRWEEVSVPHTLKLTDVNLDGCDDSKFQETFHRTVGWYRRVIEVSENPTKVFLEFEGAHQVTDLWVNGEHVGQHAIGGYTPFHFDITSFVSAGENQIALRVDNRKRDDTPPDPGPYDYVKFSGLYRDVYLVETGGLRVTFAWEDFYAGVSVTTPTVDPLNGNATIAVRTTVRNESEERKDCRVLTRVVDGDGVVVMRMADTQSIPAGEDRTFNQCGGIDEDLHLWSCDDPYLYRVNTTVWDNDDVIDCVENPLGVRSLALSKEHGVLLNGEPVDLFGSNRHQHYAFIGDAMPNSLHYKDVLQLKQKGMNIIRTAHYPQDDALLDACDRLGVLVYEEAPTWIGIGNDAWFDNLERAARRMVRNHRNHPSIIIWGAGINHRGAVPRLHYAIKQEDPTRWTASNNSAWTGEQNSGVCDLFTNMDYRGVDDWTGEEYLLAMEGKLTPESIALYGGDPLRLGLIHWTAHAYYTFHPTNKSDNRMRSGMMDGFRNAALPEDESYGEPVAMRIDVDMEGRELTADGNDIVLAYTRFVDKDGKLVPGPDVDVRYVVDGPGEIVGEGEIDGANPAPVSRGAAPVLIRAGLTAGEIHITAECEGFDTVEATLASVPFNPDRIETQARAIYDLRRLHVDMGGEGQLVQFGWQSWVGENNQPATFEADFLGGMRATLKPASDGGITRWLGEMNVKGRNGFVMGEGVCVIDPEGFALELSGLPEGRYELTTYHHAPVSNTNSMDPNRERLKTLKIHQIPVASVVDVTTEMGSTKVTVSTGKQVPDEGPGKAVVAFEVDDSSPVEFRFRDADGERGVWLNGFELRQAR